MKVYIRSYENGIPRNYNFMNAYQGFREMGFEIVPFHDIGKLRESRKEDIVVGYVDNVRERLYDLGIVTPEMDYPEELHKYLGRKIWQTKMSKVSNVPERWPVFVKPLEDKQFTGVVVRSAKDLIGCGIEGTDQDVYCSEVVEFEAEWRCFVRYGHILGVRPYKGDWRKHFDHKVIENAVKDFVSAPAGYAIDFGLTADGRTLLIEVNDGYALGCYGLFYIDYAKLLSARWAELTGTEDECAFDIV
ncbi:MAG: ATP-grasp domain-containing protein [Oscillospiraceae bacterium]|nr:ATP-grasp domain-containing protein [Oscillospiraceae bacterium]